MSTEAVNATEESRIRPRVKINSMFTSALAKAEASRAHLVTQALRENSRMIPQTGTPVDRLSNKRPEPVQKHHTASDSNSHKKKPKSHSNSFSGRRDHTENANDEDEDDDDEDEDCFYDVDEDEERNPNTKTGSRVVYKSGRGAEQRKTTGVSAPPPPPRRPPPPPSPPGLGSRQTANTATATNASTKTTTKPTPAVRAPRREGLQIYRPPHRGTARSASRNTDIDTTTATGTSSTMTSTPSTHDTRTVSTGEPRGFRAERRASGRSDGNGVGEDEEEVKAKVDMFANGGKEEYPTEEMDEDADFTNMDVEENNKKDEGQPLDNELSELNLMANIAPGSPLSRASVLEQHVEDEGGSSNGKVHLNPLHAFVQACDSTPPPGLKFSGTTAVKPGGQRGVNGRGVWGGGNTVTELMESGREERVASGRGSHVETTAAELGEDLLDDDTCPKPAAYKMRDDFVCMETVRSKDLPEGGTTSRRINTVSGLELHSLVLNSAEQARLVKYIHNLEKQGQAGELKGRTYTAPRKWMKGKGRVTIQFGCVYNYATDSKGRPPGILLEDECEEMPPLFCKLIQRMIRWGIIPKGAEPDSAIVNLYSVDDCIPPHIDHHDFVRPFFSLSLLSQQDIQFGYAMKPAGPGEFESKFRLSLPPGSVLTLKGNGADVAKHCVPAVSSPRISITFRRMDDYFRQQVGLPVNSDHVGGQI